MTCPYTERQTKLKSGTYLRPLQAEYKEEDDREDEGEGPEDMD